MLVIFSALADAQAYVDEINVAMGYPIPGSPATPLNPDGSPGEGWTVDWDVPNKSYTEDLWAVCEAPSESGVEVPSSAVDLLALLPASWYPPPDD